MDSKSGISKDEITKIKTILEQVENDPKAYEFLEPVDHVGLGLVDYLQIVKTPMDVSSIKKKLKGQKYTSSQQVVDDIMLIWANCKKYNMEGSEIYKMADALEKTTKKLIEKHLKPKTVSNTIKKGNSFNNYSQTPENKEEFNDSDNYEEEETNNPDRLTIQEKLQLTDRVKKLSNDGLAALVRLVQKECGNAIEDLDAERLQIRVDLLDKKTYSQITQLIDTFLKVRETHAENAGKKQSVTSTE